MSDGIYRVWATQKRTPNPIQKSLLDEETIQKIAQTNPEVNYFFLEETT